MSKKITDVTIVGAGIAGLSLALALSRKNFTVNLLDSRELNYQSSHDDLNLNRVVALNHSSIKILDNLKVWDKIKPSVGSYKKMYIYEQDEVGSISFSADELGLSKLGYIVSNDIIINTLLGQALEEENINIHLNQTVKKLNLGDVQTVVTNEGLELESSLVVGADGANSTVRDLLGIECNEKPYSHTAIVATVELERGHDNTAWQRFANEGPLAFLPLKDDKLASIVYSSDNSKFLLGMDDKQFSSHLSNVTDGVFGKISLKSQRVSFPLARKHVSEYGVLGCVLVADAAHLVHPLAGQGINLGLLDVASLVDILCQSRQNNCKLSSKRIVIKLEESRRIHNAMLLLLTDNLKKLFANDNSIVTLVRNLGLNLLDKNIWLKKQMVNVALGKVGELPSLAKT